MTDDPAARELLFRLAAVVVLADRSVTEAERAWLGRLARTFGLSEERQRTLEAEVFEAPL